MFFHLTIAYQKENSKVKDKFFQENSYPEIRKSYFLAPKYRVDLFMGSTYTRLNTHTLCEIYTMQTLIVTCDVYQILSAVVAIVIFTGEGRSLKNWCTFTNREG